MDHQQIVWLASYPKSGNTWVRCFLDAYFLGEVDINEIICSLSDDNSLRHQIGDGSDVRDLPVDLQQLTRPMAMLRLVRMYNENKIDGVPLFVKTHSANMLTNGIELLPQMLTKAVIHIIRDPRDVAISFAKHMGVDIDTAIEYMGDKYRVLKTDEGLKVIDFLSSWRMHSLSYYDSDHHNVRTFVYEDMLKNPVDNFCEILRHSGVDPDRERVRKSLEMVKIEKLRAQEEKNGFYESSPRAKNQFFGKGGSRWKEKLTPLQAKRIEKMTQTILKKIA